jgi:hypothetical protein
MRVTSTTGSHTGAPKITIVALVTRNADECERRHRGREAERLA